MGPRSASIRVQIVALVLGILEGYLLDFAVVRVSLLLLPEALDGPLRFLCIAFCAYFFAAPATWRGLTRRCLLILGVSLLGYGVLGYLLAFLVLRGSPISGSMPSLILIVQAIIAVVGVGAVAGFVVLRDQKQHAYVTSATEPTPEVALGGRPSDAPG